MALLIPIILLSFIGAAVRTPLFEFVFGSILLAPITGYLLGRFLSFPLTMGGYTLIVLLHMFVLFILLGRRKDFTSVKRELAPLGVFSGLFLLSYSLCVSWPDFFPMGERLRDYSILTSVLQNPLWGFEPWMAGHHLNYYLYWYRFGHFLSQILGLPVWETYHTLIAFGISFFGASAFRIFRDYLRFSLGGAIASMLIVTFGSNIQGVSHFLRGDDNWWGPSRVVKGAINEFPVWSFVLGDAHPHYLNLGLAPFLLCCGIAVARSALHLSEKIFLFLFAAPVTALWFFNSNGWEKPIWLGLLGVVFAFVLVQAGAGTFLRDLTRHLVSSAQAPWSRLTPLRPRFSALVGGAFLVHLFLLLSLYISSLNILTDQLDLNFALVRSPIEVTHVSELFLHWGVPITLLSVCLVTLLPSANLAWVSIAGLLGSLLFQNAEVLLFLLFFLNAVRLTNLKGPLPPERVVIEALGLSALGLIILPEVMFLNDTYGGENERMNTIFKIYSFCWFPLHAFAFFLLGEVLRPLSSAFSEKIPAIAQKVGTVALQAVAVALLLGFFQQLITIRTPKPPAVSAEGLGSAEQQFPGSTEIIRKLRALPPSIVLEAQGKPYDWTTFVATLSHQTAYLGWANHMNLLLREYEEVGNRERVTKEIYTGSDCSSKRELVVKQGIQYVVLGSLEKREYPDLTLSSFGCFQKVAESGEYLLMAP
jgi:uncharacterized membrane protein